MRSKYRLDRTCLQCGKAFAANPSTTRLGWGKFCSLDCSGQSRVKPLAERLSAKLDTSSGPDACWLWMGWRTPDGYGKIWAGDGTGRDLLTHRAVYELTCGPLPPGQCARHFVCDNPPCCNPRHLRLGSNAENVADRVRKRRSAVATNRHARLTDALVRAVRSDQANGVPMRAIATRYGIHQSTVSRVVSGKTWRHVT